jgi:hypothetical protein
MPVLQQTDDRVRFVCVCVRHAGAFVTLDRRRNRADIYSLALVVPFRRRSVALTEIVGAQVGKREHDDGGASYSSVLRLKHGDSIKFACGTRDEAMSMMRLVTKFLHLE